MYEYCIVELDETRRDGTRLSSRTDSYFLLGSTCVAVLTMMLMPQSSQPSQPSQLSLVHLSCQPTRFSRKDKTRGKEKNNVRNFSQPSIRSRCTGCVTIQIYDVAYDLNLFSDVGAGFNRLDIGFDSVFRSGCEVCATYVRRNALVRGFHWSLNIENE